ncbi:MAG TPA: hypothetical protein PKA90_02005 [Ignavibacteria bacterium]|nr:hypothetical protein [Ignavibacteria bacterium]HMR39182.1 hypothetical protein [Ignavibacteria bacterium]
MAKSKQQNVQNIKSRKTKRELSHLHFALTSKNYMIIASGIVLIILGYILMSENSVDGFLPTIVAPILLIFGYCVVVPIGILYNAKSEDTPAADESKESGSSDNENKTSSSSNIKTA